MKKFISNIDQKCIDLYFNKDGSSIKKGIKFFTCCCCKEVSANYSLAQETLCHKCSEKLRVCIYCGKPLGG